MAPFSPQRSHAFARALEPSKRSLTPQWHQSDPLAPALLPTTRHTPVFTTKSREDLEKEQQTVRNSELVSYLSQQIQLKRDTTQMQLMQRRKDAEKAKVEREQLQARNRSDRIRRVEQRHIYKRALDAQSGQGDQQVHQANSMRFFGCAESRPSQDFSTAADRFFGTDSDTSTPTSSLSPVRIAKTSLKTTLMDPITGTVRTLAVSRGRIHSLGNARPVYVAGKISESPPPRSVFWEQPNFGKKVPRREVFNPLTGERVTVGEKSAPNISKSSVPPQSGSSGSKRKLSSIEAGLSPYHYSFASNRQR